MMAPAFGIDTRDPTLVLRLVNESVQTSPHCPRVRSDGEYPELDKLRE